MMRWDDEMEGNLVVDVEGSEWQITASDCNITTGVLSLPRS